MVFPKEVNLKTLLVSSRFVVIASFLLIITLSTKGQNSSLHFSFIGEDVLREVNVFTLMQYKCPGYITPGCERFIRIISNERKKRSSFKMHRGKFESSEMDTVLFVISEKTRKVIFHSDLEECRKKEYFKGIDKADILLDSFQLNNKNIQYRHFISSLRFVARHSFEEIPVLLFKTSIEELNYIFPSTIQLYSKRNIDIVIAIISIGNAALLVKDGNG